MLNRLFVGVMVALALVCSSALLTYGLDDPEERCKICDDGSYHPSDRKDVVYFLTFGVDEGDAHRSKKLQVWSGSGFVFTSPTGSRHVAAPPRICTAWHVVSDFEGWEHGTLLMYLWNMVDTAEVRVTRYDEEKDLAVLEFADPGYVYPGDVLELGDDGWLDTGDNVIAIGAPESHCFMESSGELLDRCKANNGTVRLRHNAKTTHGDSGGPLLNSFGEVVGVNVAFDHAGDKFMWSIAATVSDLKALLAPKKAKKRKKWYVCDGTLNAAAWGCCI